MCGAQMVTGTGMYFGVLCPGVGVVFQGGCPGKWTPEAEHLTMY